MQPTILFLCPHGAAKSVMAAAYCQRLAAEHSLDWQATSAGTEPSSQVAPAVVELLRGEGYDVAGHKPRHVTPDELTAAFRVISLGCDVSHLAPPEIQIEYWDDIPLPSQDLMGARERIYIHVRQLVTEYITGYNG